jgi:hypothetical protein
MTSLKILFFFSFITIFSFVKTFLLKQFQTIKHKKIIRIRSKAIIIRKIYMYV